MPKPNLFRQLALATALADGLPRREITQRFASEWGIQTENVALAIRRLLASWATRRPHKYKVINPWQKTKITIDRMNQLREALVTCESRRAIVQRFAAQWDRVPGYVDQLVTRVMDEDQHELLAQIELQRQRYLARLRTSLSRHVEHNELIEASKAYERLTLVENV